MTASAAAMSSVAPGRRRNLGGWNRAAPLVAGRPEGEGQSGGTFEYAGRCAKLAAQCVSPRRNDRVS